jgi:hypothetical protein
MVETNFVVEHNICSNREKVYSMCYKHIYRVLWIFQTNKIWIIKMKKLWLKELFHIKFEIRNAIKKTEIQTLQVHCRFNIQIPVFQTYKHKFYFTLFEILGEFKSYPVSIVGNTIECKTILISSSNFNFVRSLVNNLDTEIKLSDAISSKFEQVNA